MESQLIEDFLIFGNIWNNLFNEVEVITAINLNDKTLLKVYLHDSVYVELKWLQNLNWSELNNMHIKIAETIIELKVSKKLNDVWLLAITSIH